jgi:hypothetical protein
MHILCRTALTLENKTWIKKRDILWFALDVMAFMLEECSQKNIISSYIVFGAFSSNIMATILQTSYKQPTCTYVSIFIDVNLLET